MQIGADLRQVLPRAVDEELLGLVRDVNQCLDGCPDLSENQQRTVARCGEGACADQLNCLGFDCFSDGDCAAGTPCVGNACL